MLSLQPPVPTGSFVFEEVFRPCPAFSRTNFLRLTASRIALRHAAAELVADGEEASKETIGAAVQAAEAYRARWLPFWTKRLAGHAFAPPTKRETTTQVPLAFRWRVNVYGSEAVRAGAGSVEYTDPSPIAETVCATLALAVALHRSGEFARAGSLVAWTRENVLPLFRPWIGRPGKEPHFLSEAFLGTVALAIDGQRACKEALLWSVRGEPARATAVRMFRGARKFRDAHVLVPGEEALQATQRRVTASAYRYLSQAVAEETSHMGVAVACARQAVAEAARSTNCPERTLAGHKGHLETLERRNENEAGFQPVPEQGKLRLSFSRVATAVCVEERDEAAAGTVYTIVVPVSE